MAFIGKKDYTGITVDGKLVIAGDSQGASGSVVTAQDDTGSVTASTAVAGGASATNEYDVKAEVPFTGGSQIRLGSVATVGDKKYMLKGVSVGTSSSAGPTVSASADQVEADAVTACTYDVPEFTVPKAHHASFIFAEVELSGAGCKQITTSYTITADTSISRGEDGAAIASDVHNGRIEATATIQQSAATEPSVTPAEGWTISSPLTQTNSKGAYPTWTVGLVKYLTKTTPAA